MAESQGVPKLMLNPREKLTGALLIGTAFATFVATLLLTAIFACRWDHICIRGFLLLGVIVWNMFNVFVSLNAVGSEPRLATSKTLLQQLDGISFLVTTTSTVQVTPSWIIFFAACSFAIFVLATVPFGVYVRMRYVERKEEIELKKKRN
ncbi:hypothetical protein SELMODRAFT_419919 [Selaginella moellendorffii]|uniref:Uncharacterized protein n=1 Tax=Selaginella moellendorffii TaxID=88036 RepID=D8SA03_SELML|nr:hypothetical protein SELMODRAFT_419919 [Selaginella moellendorffii]